MNFFIFSRSNMVLTDKDNEIETLSSYSSSLKNHCSKNVVHIKDSDLTWFWGVSLLLCGTETYHDWYTRRKLLLGSPRSWSLAFFFIFNIFEHINVLSPWPFITITTSGVNRQDVENLLWLGIIIHYAFFINHLALPNSKSYGFYNNPNIGCEPARWNSLLHRNTGIS